MYQGSHSRRKKHSRIRMNKLAILFIAVVMLIGAVVGSTVAFLVTETDPVENKFSYASISTNIKENFDGETKKDVQVVNNGDTAAYIRATYVINWLDKGGNIVSSVPGDYNYQLELNIGNNWILGTDGFYYYKEAVAPGASTAGSLLTCKAVYPANPEYTLSVEILATAIQSTPASAARNAWPGMPGSVN